MSVHLVVLAVLAALNPTLVVVALVLLARPRPRATMTAFLSGGLLVSLLAGILAISVLHGAGLGSGTQHGSRIGPQAAIAIGVLSLATAFALALWDRRRRRAGRPLTIRHRRKHEQEEQPKPSFVDRMLSRGGVPIAFLAGIALDLPGSCYIVALASLADEHGAFAAWFGPLVIFNVIMFLPLELPLLLYARNPDATERRLNAFLDGLRRNAVALGAGVLGIAGAYMTLHGVATIG